MQEWIWLGVVFVVVAGLCFAVLQWDSRRRRRLEERLEQAAGQPEPGSGTDLVLGPLTPDLASQVPMRESTRTDLAQELRAAGFYRPTAVMEYAAIRWVLVVVPLVITGVLVVLLSREQLPWVLLGGFAAAVLGFSLPRLYVNYRAKVRGRQIERGLPVTVDLLVLALSGGQHIMPALRRVGREIRPAYPVLADELQIVQQQAELRSLNHALLQWADRVRVPEVRNLAVILSHAEQMGTDIATALLEFANNFRLSLRQRAETQANRATFWMVFPTLFCLWIPAAMILMAPIYAEFVDRTRKAKETISNPREAIERLNRELRRPTPTAPSGASSAPTTDQPQAGRPAAPRDAGTRTAEARP
jgi:tight adherence protein C